MSLFAIRPFRTLLLVAACALACSACVRLGYIERSEPASDGGTPHRRDATTPNDATSASDASREADAEGTAPDAADTIADASTGPDAADKRPDASVTPDAADTPDATDPMADASTTPDASVHSDAGTQCTRSAARDYCTRLPALPSPPQLDGVLDCGPSLIDLPATGWNSAYALPADNHARYAAAWRPDGLYFYVEVDDMLRLPALASHEDPWCGDGVELYADSDGVFADAPDYDDPGAIQLLATAPARDATTALAVDARYHTRSLARAGDWAAARHVSVPRTGGYALEAFVAAADLELNSWSLSAGGSVGFDIAINVSVTNEANTVGCGYSLGQYYLRVSRLPCNTDSCRPHTNAAAFCSAVLE